MGTRSKTFTVLVLILASATNVQFTIGHNTTVDGQQEFINGTENTSETFFSMENATFAENENENKTAFDYIVEAHNQTGKSVEVHEFDMRFPKAQSDASEDEQDAPIRDRSALWPRGIIPYELGNSIRNQRWIVKLIQGAMHEWEAKTCIKFRQKTRYDRNYIHIHIGVGCNSDVGMVGGRQTVSLGSGCTHHSVILHELGHVVGFWHEQNRPDRDQYVRILRENIIKNLYFAFHKYSTHKIDSLGVPYDYKSIMHYSRKAFSKNGKDTIVALDGKTKDFGNDHLSALDILQANKLYKCPDKTNQYPSFPEDFTFSLSKLSSLGCTQLYEPHDRYWKQTYLCVKAGKKYVKIRWSNKGALPRMACTRVYSREKHFNLGWNDNFLCVPTKSPYKFKWSVSGPLRGYQCMKWSYPRDTRWGSRQYLCAKSDDKPVNGNWSPWSIWSQCNKKCGRGFQYRRRECNNPEPKNGGRPCDSRSYESRYCNEQKCQDLPRWPDDFTYRYHAYTPSTSTCIRTYERQNYFQWTNYYFCSRAGRRDINMKWSDDGPIPHLRCTRIYEPREPRTNGWHNNYLCVPKNSPYNFRWSHSGRIGGLACLQWIAKKGYNGWNNNYLCAKKYDGKPIRPKRKVVDGGWTTWGSWTKCSRTCDTGTRIRFRSCSNPYPRNGGRSCSGGREMRENCKIRDCPRLCDKTYIAQGSRMSGTFRAPVHDRGQISCSWTIKAPLGYRIRLQFRYFSVGVSRTDCMRGSDYVTVRAGQYRTSLIVRSLCGSRIPPAVETNGNIMRVNLESANNIRRAGFGATWKAVPIPTVPPTPKYVPLVCGGALKRSKGNITTPNYPKNYPFNKECVWIIKVPVHKLLKLRFLSFDLESHSRCKYDYVEIRDGATERSTLLGTFCGTRIPNPVTAFTNSLWIKFHSDNSRARTGFLAEYYTEKRKIKGCIKRWRHYVAGNGEEYCYLIRYKRAKWEEARKDCRKKKSDLLSIATKGEQWFVRNELMAETKYYELWLGYNDRRKEGTWAWSDKSVGTVNYWGGGEPNNGGRRKNEDCGVVKPDGNWNDFPCDSRFMYICKRKLT